MKLVIIFILFICVTVINGKFVTLLDGRCPFSSLKPSPLAVVPLLKGKSNIIAMSVVGKDNRTDIVILYQQLGRDQIKITERYLSLESGRCEQNLFFLNATKTPGVFDNNGPGKTVPSKLFFLSNGTISKSVVFSCQNLPDEKFQFEIVLYSAFTKKFGQAEKDYVKMVLNENGLSSFYKYVTGIDYSTGKSPCGFSPKEVSKTSSPVKV